MHDGLDERLQVVDELGLFEGDLADRRVDDARLVDPELDLAGLGLLDGLADVEGDRAGLGVGHEALGAQDAAELADAAHDVGGGDDDVEVDPAAGDLLDDVVAAEVIGPGLLGLLDLLARGDDADLLRLARAVGQDDGASDHLVRILGIDPQPDVDVDGFVELGEMGLLEEGDGLLEGVLLDLFALDGPGLDGVLAVLTH